MILSHLFNVGCSQEGLSKLLCQQRLIQLTDESLENIGHIMLTAHRTYLPSHIEMKTNYIPT